MKRLAARRAVVQRQPPRPHPGPQHAAQGQRLVGRRLIGHRAIQVLGDVRRQIGIFPVRARPPLLGRSPRSRASRSSASFSHDSSGRARSLGAAFSSRADAGGRAASPRARRAWLGFLPGRQSRARRAGTASLLAGHRGRRRIGGRARPSMPPRARPWPPPAPAGPPASPGCCPAAPLDRRPRPRHVGHRLLAVPRRGRVDRTQRQLGAGHDRPVGHAGLLPHPLGLQQVLARLGLAPLLQVGQGRAVQLQHAVGGLALRRGASRPGQPAPGISAGSAR